MINSISYLIYQKDNPEEKGTKDSIDILCNIQSSILVFGDISRLALAIGYIVVAYLTFLDPTTVEVHKFRFFIIILIVCQIMPLIFGIICGIVDKEPQFQVFCFVKEDYYLLATKIIRFVMIVIFYIMIAIFHIYFSKTFKEQTNEEFYKSFIRKIIRYAILITFTLILLICFIVSDLFLKKNNSIKQELPIIYLILNILNGILNPLYVLFFVLNRSKYEELKNLICCKKQIEDENYLDDEYQMEIV